VMMQITKSFFQLRGRGSVGSFAPPSVNGNRISEVRITVKEIDPSAR
jgi:hypothetical protein